MQPVLETFSFLTLVKCFPLLHICLFFYSHIRQGAPPVVNPAGSSFPNETLWSPSLSLSLPVVSQTFTTFNLSNPAAGDWFVAAHLPVDDGRIEQKVCVKRHCTLFVCFCWSEFFSTKVAEPDYFAVLFFSLYSHDSFCLTAEAGLLMEGKSVCS